MSEERLPEEVQKALTAMIPVPEPNPVRLAARRSAFLAEARQLRRHQAVSVSPAVRLRNWIDFHFRRKESNAMFTLAKVALAMVAIVGMAGGTVYGADNSLPGQPLYPLDLELEQAQLVLAPTVQARTRLEVQFTSERAAELIQMEQHGQTPDQASLTRLRAQVQTSLRDLAALPLDQSTPLLAQLRTMSQERAQLMTQLGYGDGSQVMLQAQEAAQYGLDDPQGFQQRYRGGDGQPVNDATATPLPDVVTTDEPVTPTQDRQRDQTRDQDGSCLDGTTTCVPDQDQIRQQDQDQTHDGTGDGPQWSETPGAQQPGGPQNEDAGGGDNGKGQNGKGH